MSTMPLLPPERSHICMAFGRRSGRNRPAGSGVGAAAGADADASALAAAGLLAAGAADDGAAPLGAEVAVPELHAPITRIATNARAGNLRWLLIPCSSKYRTHPGRPVDGCRRSATPSERDCTTHAIECIHSISRLS